jgi:hypothetical protein
MQIVKGEEGKFYVWTYADWQQALEKIEIEWNRPRNYLKNIII